MKKKWYAYALIAILAAGAAISLYTRSRTQAPQDAAEASSPQTMADFATDAEPLPPAAAAETASQTTPPAEAASTAPAAGASLLEAAPYTTRDEVALYIHEFGHLPHNFITKREARELGWTGGSLEPFAPGKSIGGDTFSNREGLLPKEKGVTYTECDIDAQGKKSRGAKRIVFSSDGRIYYTGDHYQSFTRLY